MNASSIHDHEHEHEHGFAPVGFALLLALLPLAASAATITVNTTADNLTAGNGKCTLREAIANVNAAAETTGGDCTAGSGAGDTIKFGFAMPAKIRLKLGQLRIQRDVIIVNGASGLLHIDAFGQSRVFEIATGTTSMSNLSIERGKALRLGGGVLVDNGATLNLAACRIAGNTARIDPNDADADISGGGVYNAGTLNLTNCKLMRNTLVVGDGIGFGAAMFSADGSIATLTNCALAGNKVEASMGEARGGGIQNVGGSVTLTNCALTRNRANAGTDGFASGGAISNDDGRGIGTLILVDSTFIGNRARARRYGIANGGAVFNGSMVTLTNCTVSRNTAIAGSDAVLGGAIENFGNMALTNCTLDRNAARVQGNVLQTEADGGCIHNLGSLTMTNCTLVSNSATGRAFSDGGAISNEGDLALINCTLSGNTVERAAPDLGRGIGGISGAAHAVLTNTIIADNGGAGNCDVEAVSGGHNLSSDDSCFSSGGSDLLNTKPQLAVLGNYGGPTQTMALCTGAGMPPSCRAASPAIDAGDDTVTGPPINLTTDQRGLSRLSGAHVDIGAYEAQ